MLSKSYLNATEIIMQSLKSIEQLYKVKIIEKKANPIRPYLIKEKLCFERFFNEQSIKSELSQN